MLDTLYELKAKYERERLVAEAKIAVVTDLIAIEEEKLKQATNEMVVESEDCVVEEGI